MKYSKHILLLILCLLFSTVCVFGNSPPTAFSDSFFIDEDGSVVGTLQGTDADGDPLTFSLASSPSSGRVSSLNSATGSFIYDPKANYHGSTSFSFTVSDGIASSSALITITIRPVNDVPVANSGGRFSVEEEGFVSGTLSGYDVDGDSLTFSLASSSVSSGGDFNLRPDGSFDFSPAENFSGEIAAAFTVNDGEVESAWGIFFIDVLPINDPPEAFPAEFIVRNDETREGTLFGTDVDEEDSLVYSIVEQPSYGALSLNQDGTFIFKPDRAYVGSDSFTFQVSDGEYQSEPATVSIDITLGEALDDVGLAGDLFYNGVSFVNLKDVDEASRINISAGGREIVLDLAIDYSRSRAFMLTKDGFLIVCELNLDHETIQIQELEKVKVKGSLIALTPDSSRAFIASEGTIRSVNLYPTFRGGERIEAYQDWRTYVERSSKVVAMEVHPDGEQLAVVTQENEKAVGVLFMVDITIDEGFTIQSHVVLLDPIEKEGFHKISDLAISPDGNYALVVAEGSQVQYATPFGIRPRSDEQTGGIAIVDLNSLSLVGVLSTTVEGENRDAIIEELRRESRVTHPLVSYWQAKTFAAEAGFSISSFSPIIGSYAATEYLFSLEILSLYMQAYKDYGLMAGYANAYSTDMVAASGVAISNRGDLGLVTMEDTNNLGIMSLGISTKLRGYGDGVDAEPFSLGTNIFVRAATQKWINGHVNFETSQIFGSETFADVNRFAHMQEVKFTPGDEWAIVGMRGGLPDFTEKSNGFGRVEIAKLKEHMKNTLPEDAVREVVARVRGNHIAPVEVDTFSEYDTDDDGVSDHVEAFNRWNFARFNPNLDRFNQWNFGLDSDKITVTEDRIVSYSDEPGAVISHPTTPQDSDCEQLYFLPHSGLGYRFNRFDNPRFSMSLGTWITIASIESVGRLWHKKFLNEEVGRLYFQVSFMAAPNDDQLKNTNGEILAIAPRDGTQACIPYFKVNSDAAHDFVLSNMTADPLNNTIESIQGYDAENTETLVRLLLNTPTVKSVHIDPLPLDMMAEDIQEHPKIFSRGILEEGESRRDLDSFMLVEFHCAVPIDLDVDSDNNGGLVVIGETDEEEAIENPRGEGFSDDNLDAPGKVVMAITGDRDLDSIPDFADHLIQFRFGDNPQIWSKSGELETPRLVPVLLKFPNSGLRNSLAQEGEIKLLFKYDGSDPREVKRTRKTIVDEFGDRRTILQYDLPDKGKLRLWEVPKSGENGTGPRKQPQIYFSDDLRDGGNYIKPEQWYSVEELGFDDAEWLPLLVEPLKHNDILAGEFLTVQVGVEREDGSMMVIGSDAVAFTILEMDLIEVDVHGRRKKVLQPEPSDSSPVIEVKMCEIVPDSVKENAEGVLVGDIEISLTVTCEVCNMYPDAPKGVISEVLVYVNGSEDPTYVLNVNGDSPSAGPNTRYKRGALDNSDKKSQNNFYPYTGTVSNVVLKDVPLLEGNNTIKFIAEEFVGGGIGRAECAFTSEDLAEYDFDEDGNWVVINQEELDQLGAARYTTTPAEVIKKSNPGEYHVYMYKFNGPPKFLENMLRTQFTSLISARGGQSNQNFAIIKVGAEYFLGDKSSGRPELVAYAALNPNYVDEALDAQAFEDTLDKLNTIIEYAPGLSDEAKVFIGYMYGVGAGGYEIIGSTLNLAKTVVEATTSGATVVVAYYIGEDELAEAALEEWDEAVNPLIDGFNVVYQFIITSIEDAGAYYIGYLVGDELVTNAIGDKYAPIIEFGYEALEIISEELKTAELHEQGYYLGRLMAEIVAILLPTQTVAKAARLEKMTKASFLEELASRINKVMGDRAGSIKQKLLTAAGLFKGTRMCFVAGTPVHTKQGLVPIEEIQPGMMVLSRDLETKEQAYRQVVDTVTTYPERLYHITIDTGKGAKTLTCTAEHPFYVVTEDAFVPAGELKVDDHLSLSDSSEATVREIVIEESAGDEPFTTYNFEVADFHTYFVGESGVWVHNSGKGHCETVYQLYLLYRKNAPANETPYQTLVRIKERMESATGVGGGKPTSIPSKVWGRASMDVTQGMLNDYTGAIDLANFPTFNNWVNSVFKRAGVARSHAGVEVHHVVEKYIQKLLGLPDSVKNTCPGIPMPRNKAILDDLNDGFDEADKLFIIHNGPVSEGGLAGTLHASKNIPTGSTMSRQEIINKLKEVYESKDEWENLWPPARDWLLKMQADGHLPRVSIPN